MRGHCFCGAIAFEVDGATQSCVVCHCESCRRQCSAPMTTYIGVLDGQWRLAGQLPEGIQLFSRRGKNILRSLWHATVLPLKEHVQCHAFFCGSAGGAGKICTYAACRF